MPMTNLLNSLNKLLWSIPFPRSLNLTYHTNRLIESLERICVLYIISSLWRVREIFFRRHEYIITKSFWKVNSAAFLFCRDKNFVVLYARVTGPGLVSARGGQGPSALLVSKTMSKASMFPMIIP